MPDPAPRPHPGELCGASTGAIRLGDEPPHHIGPCVLRKDHDGPVHQAADGSQWAGDVGRDTGQELDEAVRAVAEQLLRDYDSEHDASHLHWRDFGPQARRLVEIAAPHIERYIRRQALQDLDAGRVTDEDLAAAGLDTAHIVNLRADGWTIQHPLTCRADLFGCPVNRAAERDLTEPPPQLGWYVCALDDSGRFALGEAR